MKRLIYMSSFARTISDDEIKALGEGANARNNVRGITGVLLCLDKTFFQILEGDDGIIDDLFESIKKDPRHKDVVCLINEDRIRDRCFPGRYMHTVNLNTNKDLLVQPVKVLLQQLTQSHRIIGKYTRPTVMKTLMQGMNPLELAAKRTVNAMFFADIQGFSRISEEYPVDDVVKLLNRYLAAVTEAITEHGGEVDKYMGDCVMAYFDAEQADNALHAALRILEALAAIRAEALPHTPESGLYAGIGIDYGEIIQGNVGSSTKMDYTLLGSVVNRAQGLERLTRELPVLLVFSEQLKDAATQPWDFVSLGKHPVKGKEEHLELYSLDNLLVNGFEYAGGAKS